MEIAALDNALAVFQCQDHSGKSWSYCRGGMAGPWREHRCQLISCVRGIQRHEERKDTEGKRDFCYIFVVLEEKKEFGIWLRKQSTTYSTIPTYFYETAFIKCYWYPTSLLCYCPLKFKAKKLLRVGYIYLPSPSLEANITSKIPCHISLLPEVSVLICPPPHNQTPFHTWVNLESHLEREPREPVQWTSGNCASEAFMKVKYFWAIFPATFFVKCKPTEAGNEQGGFAEVSNSLAPWIRLPHIPACSPSPFSRQDGRLHKSAQAWAKLVSFPLALRVAETFEYTSP